MAILYASIADVNFSAHPDDPGAFREQSSHGIYEYLETKYVALGGLT